MAVDGHAHAVVHPADVAGDDHIGAARVHLEHRVTGVGVLVDDVLDGAFQLHKLLFLLFHSRPLPANRRTFTDKDIIPHCAAFGKFICSK